MENMWNCYIMENGCRHTMSRVSKELIMKNSFHPPHLGNTDQSLKKVNCKETYESHLYFAGVLFYLWEVS